MNLEGDQLKVRQAHYWTVTVPGRLGSREMNFFSVEKDVGLNVAGESNRCMILAEGAATRRAPTKLLEGYIYNSITKLHLDLFQMSLGGERYNACQWRDCIGYAGQVTANVLPLQLAQRSSNHAAYGSQPRTAFRFDTGCLQDMTNNVWS